LSALFVFAAFTGVAFLTACSTTPIANSPRRVSQHFEFYWEGDTVSKEELQNLESQLEIAYPKVADYLRFNFSSRFKVVLGSEAKDGDVPQVDEKGVIRLFRFPFPGKAFLQGVPHEIVHAVRHERNTRVEGGREPHPGFYFMEEGLAQYISDEVAGPHISFPTFGRSLDVIAGNWIREKASIPLSVLFTSPEVSFKCMLQSYPLRASFLKYLFETEGKQKVLRLVNAGSRFDPDLFRRYLGRDADELFFAWETWAIKKFIERKDAASVLKDLKVSTPFFSFKICRKGEDWP